MILYVATENAGKIREMQAIFAAALPGWQVCSVRDLPEEWRNRYHADETGTTYEENALIKARALARLVMASTRDSAWVLAEDSGFEVEALGGAPGVYSARYAANDQARCEKILTALKDLPLEKRRAQFVACIALLGAGENPAVFLGHKPGFVAAAMKGSQGFGYDPIFCPEANGPTWGELGEEEKNRDSHRRRALDLMIHYLAGVVKGGQGV